MSDIFDKHILTKLFVNSYSMFIKNQIFSRGSDEYFTIFVANNFYCLFLIQKNIALQDIPARFWSNCE